MLIGMEEVLSIANLPTLMFRLREAWLLGTKPATMTLVLSEKVLRARPRRDSAGVALRPRLLASHTTPSTTSLLSPSYNNHMLESKPQNSLDHYETNIGKKAS